MAQRPVYYDDVASALTAPVANRASATLSATVAIPAGATGAAAGGATQLLSVSLGVGVWLVNAQALISVNSGTSNMDAQLVAGTATATFDGPRSASGRSSAANMPLDLSIPGCIVTVTVAGTILLVALCSSASTAQFQSNGQGYPGATAMSADKRG